MGIVISPDQVSDADVVTGCDPLRIVFERDPEVTVEVLRRLHRDLVGQFPRRAVCGMVEALFEVCDPTGLELGTHKFKARVSSHDATRDEVHDRVGHSGVGQGVALKRAAGSAPMRRQSAVE